MTTQGVLLYDELINLTQYAASGGYFPTTTLAVATCFSVGIGTSD